MTTSLRVCIATKEMNTSTEQQDCKWRRQSVRQHTGLFPKRSLLSKSHHGFTVIARKKNVHLRPEEFSGKFSGKFPQTAQPTQHHLQISDTKFHPNRITNAKKKARIEMQSVFTTPILMKFSYSIHKVGAPSRMPFCKVWLFLASSQRPAALSGHLLTEFDPKSVHTRKYDQFSRNSHTPSLTASVTVPISKKLTFAR